mmetsp:Transcript_28906/g.27820  ORF Transcript_28906/g.27820 Transcript_28906/m.27820 type:complete len:99 (-) Transcript_28906:270-566(-)
MVLFFDYKSNLYDRNSQMPEEAIKLIILKNQPWRKNLEVGDLVDCCPGTLSKFSLWTQALIQEKKFEQLTLSYIFENSPKAECFSTKSLMLAQYGTKT